MNRKRKRYKGGTVVASKTGVSWVGRFRVWVVDEQGNVKRRQRGPALGPRKGPNKITYSEARQRLDQILLAISEGPETPEATMLVATYCERYYIPAITGTNGREARLRPSARGPVLSRLRRHIRTWFDAMELGQVTSEDIGEFLKKKAEHHSRKMLRHLLSDLSTLFNEAERKGWIKQNPAKKVKVPKKAQPSRRKPSIALTEEQAVRLLNNLSGLHRDLADTLIMTGLSRSEILALRNRVINVVGTLSAQPQTREGMELATRYRRFNFILVEQGVVGGTFRETKTKNRIRVVPVDDGTLEILRRRCTMGNPDDLVFSHRAGKPLDPDNFNKRTLRRACELANIPRVTWHDFRHTHSTLIADLLPRYLVETQLGHRPHGVTWGTYVHDDFKQRQAAIWKLRALLFRIVPTCDPQAMTREGMASDSSPGKGMYLN